MKRKTVDREVLFALVWERPASEVAKELGISDVALGKLCRKLQVPKPKRGYWAQVKAGKIPKRPPLKAFIEETRKVIAGKRRGVNQSGLHGLVKLSKIQRTFFDYALQVLSESEGEKIDCDLGYDGIRSIHPDVAAQILILVQNQYENWLKSETGIVASRLGALQSIKGLVEKLLPLAKSQIIIFQKENQKGSFGNESAIIIRLSKPLQQRIAQLFCLVLKYKLPYAVSNLCSSEHAWSVRHVSSPGEYANLETLLCVSDQEVWLQCEVSRYWDSDKYRFETNHFPLQQLVSLELLSHKDIQLPALLPSEKLRPYSDRLKALREVEDIYNSLVSTFYEMEREVPSEKLALLDRLWSGEEKRGPFLNARQAWRKLDDELECWRMAIDEEKAEFCRDVLGIEKKDIVVFQQKGNPVRLRVDEVSALISEKRVYFQLYGTRFRKDGTLGKRQETLILQFENSHI